MKVALYARSATQCPADQGTAIQIGALRAYASKKGLEVVEAYICCDVGYSGVSLDRPGLKRLWHGVQAKAFDAVVMMSPCRLSRNCADLIRTLEALQDFATPVLFVEQVLLQPDSDKTYGEDERDACPLTLDPLHPQEGV